MEVRLARDRDHGWLVQAYVANIQAAPREAERFARLHVGHERALLADEGGIVLGAIGWGIRGAPRDGVAQITGLWVGERARRRGLGTLLALMALDDMAHVLGERGGGLRRAWTWVDQEQLPVRRLWEKLGFVEVAKLDGHRRPGKVDLIYARTGA